MSKYDFDTDTVEWNKERGFIKEKPSFNIEKEMGYIFSETLEAIHWKDILDYFIKGIQSDLDKLPKGVPAGEAEGYEKYIFAYSKVRNHDDAARFIMQHFLKKSFDRTDYIDLVTDIEVFGVGGRGKIGMTVDEINAARKAVMDKNHSKKPGEVDEHGKQMKGTDWTPPEVVIDKIVADIDARNT